MDGDTAWEIVPTKNPRLDLDVDKRIVHIPRKISSLGHEARDLVVSASMDDVQSNVWDASKTNCDFRE